MIGAGGKGAGYSWASKVLAGKIDIGVDKVEKGWLMRSAFPLPLVTGTSTEPRDPRSAWTSVCPDMERKKSRRRTGLDEHE